MSLSRAGSNVVASGSSMTEAELKDQRRLDGIRARAAARRELGMGRKSGKDSAIINQQIQERAAQALERQMADAAEARNQKQIRRIMLAAEQEELAKATERKRQLQATWRQQQEEREARKAKERQLDAALNQRSQMVFGGEDRAQAERKRMQQLQMKRWIDQQRADKQRADEKAGRIRKKELENYNNALRTMANMSDGAAEERSRRTKETAQANLALATERRRQDEKRKARELAASRREMDNNLNDPMLTENKAYGEKSALGAGRVRPDHWRGMNSEQRKAIAQENQRIIEANKARRSQEAEERRQYQAQLKLQCRAATIQELKAQEQAANARKTQAAEQRRQALESSKRMQREAAARKNAGFSAEFFGGFGSSSR